MRIFSTKKEREHKESESKAAEWRSVHEIVISDLLYMKVVLFVILFVVLFVILFVVLF